MPLGVGSAFNYHSLQLSLFELGMARIMLQADNQGPESQA
jgi:hypothetical protein